MCMFIMQCGHFRGGARNFCVVCGEPQGFLVLTFDTAETLAVALPWPIFWVLPRHPWLTTSFKSFPPCMEGRHNSFLFMCEIKTKGIPYSNFLCKFIQGDSYSRELYPRGVMLIEATHKEAYIHWGLTQELHVQGLTCRIGLIFKKVIFKEAYTKRVIYSMGAHT